MVQEDHTKHRSSFPFQLVIISVLVLLVTTPIIVMGVISYRGSGQSLGQLIEDRKRVRVQNTARFFQERLHRYEDLGWSFAQRVQVRRHVQQGEWFEATAYLQDIETFPNIERVFLVDIEGRLQADFPSIREDYGTDYSYRDWYKGVSASWKPYISHVYRRDAEPQLNVVSISVPIWSYTESQTDTEEESAPAPISSVVGILVMQISQEALADWVGEYSADSSEYISLVDQTGVIVASRDVGVGEELTSSTDFPPVMSLMAGMGGILRADNPITGEDQVVAFEPIEPFGWGVMVQELSEQAYAIQHQTLWWITIFFTIITILGTILALTVGYSLVRWQQYQIRKNMVERDERFRAIIENSEEVIVLVNADGKLTYVSPASTHVVGFSPEEMMGTDYITYIHPDDRETVTNIFTSLISGDQKTTASRYRVKHASGEWVWVMGVGENLIDVPRVGAIVGHFRDITEEKKAETLLRERTHELERINALMIGRELKMAELKKEIQELKITGGHTKTGNSATNDSPKEGS